MSGEGGWQHGAPWSVRTERGRATQLHHQAAQRVAPGGPVLREAVVVVAEAPAVVLGSAEPADHLDPGAVAAAGIEVVRRRSGGSAVTVGPQRSLWIDLVIGRGDPLWHDDIGRAAWWVGELWAAALVGAGIGDVAVWRSGMVRSRWSDRACFAGLGPGEVTVGGRKAVGVAQRRTRAGALFQCAALVAPLPAGRVAPSGSGAGVGQGSDGLGELVALQSLDADERAAMSEELAASTFSLSSAQASSLLAELGMLLPQG